MKFGKVPFLAYMNQFSKLAIFIVKLDQKRTCERILFTDDESVFQNLFQ